GRPLPAPAVPRRWAAAGSVPAPARAPGRVARTWPSPGPARSSARPAGAGRWPRSYEGLLLGGQLDGAGVGHAADLGEDLLLRGLDLGQAHGPAGLHVLEQDLRGALGHVGGDLLPDPGLGAAQGDRQLVAGDLAQHRLDGAVVQVGEVVEDEHQVADARAQRLVDAVDAGQDLLVLARVHEVEDVGRHPHAADGRGLEVLVAGELARHHLVQLVERVGRDAV